MGSWKEIQGQQQCPGGCALTSTSGENSTSHE